jgi:hypothetical protein
MQFRETLDEAGYSLCGTLPDGSVIVKEYGGPLEVYHPNDNYAGHVLVIGNVGHEFVRTATTTDILAAVVNDPRPEDFELENRKHQARMEGWKE